MCLTLWQKLPIVSRPMLSSEGIRRSFLNMVEWWTLRKIAAAQRGSIWNPYLDFSLLWNSRSCLTWYCRCLQEMIIFIFISMNSTIVCKKWLSPFSSLWTLHLPSLLFFYFFLRLHLPLQILLCLSGLVMWTCEFWSSALWEIPYRNLLLGLIVCRRRHPIGWGDMVNDDPRIAHPASFWIMTVLTNNI